MAFVLWFAGGCITGWLYQPDKSSDAARLVNFLACLWGWPLIVLVFIAARCVEWWRDHGPSAQR